MLHTQPVEAHVLAQRLETAVTRNAEILVVLRHLIAHVHVTQNGHQFSEPWTRCSHARCRAAQRVVEARPA